MKRNIYAFLAGGLFGAGALIADMTNTVKVQGWLDVFGAWDPTLAFVLGGAVLPMILTWRIAQKRRVAVLGNDIPAPPDSRLGANLVVGSVLFGMGWGLAGLCPGPAMASITFGGWGGLLFLLSMMAGMFVAPPIRARITQYAAQA